MAYVSQEKKASLAPAVKAICKKYKVKGTLSVSNHSTLVLTIKSGAIDFIENFNKTCSQQPRYNSYQFTPATDNISVNPYWYHEHFSGTAKKFLEEVIGAMKGPDYFDDTDIQTDYFHCSHYFDVSIGRWNKPYVFESK